MKTKDLREKSAPELQEELREASKELVDLRIRKETGQLEKPHMLKTLRKTIATLQTLLAEKHQVSVKEQFDVPSQGMTLDKLAQASNLTHRQTLRNLAKAS
jgi:large subunit ribosomal protein L29